MEKRKKIVLIGAGAIGSILASRLAKSDNDFAILADEKRINRYMRDGILFCGERIETNFITDKSSFGIADIILIAVKNYNLLEALETISPFVGEETIIIPLLNGITSEKRTAEKYSDKNTLYGYYIGHTSTRTGNDTTQDGDYVFVIGDYPSTNDPFSDRLKEVIEVLFKAGINVEGRKDMKTEIWKKFVVNVCLNQTTAYYGCTYGDILENKEILSFFDGLANEVQSVAIMEKIKGSKNFAQYAKNTLLKMNPRDRSSMAQDVQSCRKTEVEDFAGEVIRIAGKYNIICTTNKMVLNHFQK